MSEAHIQPTDFAASTDRLSPPSSKAAASSPNVEPSFVETFLSRFFQEQNIKWMLVVGAAIVFGSSLMLVMKQWPSWPIALKFLTILGYTGVVFSAAEFSRVRLRLQSTYKVLHSLTLLLLPISFLALRWLTSGSAAQTWDIVELCGLMLPATAFLWFASRRILDHLLQGRQSTFLISFCLLSMAGVLPIASTAAGAFLMMFTLWAIMTVGVVKVNRHTFWLAEEQRLPRIFGFLPIVMLGLQFTILVSTKAVAAIPVQWLGFGLIMVAATIMLTARTVADVYRRRTGDLVRPLPWNIVVPLFCGLVLTALGLLLSLKGFSYVSSTTYAVIPTSFIAAGLMFVAARDTRHAGFVWAGLICVAIGYQCCPVLFADIVNSLKQSTANAIQRERVPVSLYGVTYLPLLTILAGIGHWFLRRGDIGISRPIRQFVTLMASLLFAVAMTDVVSAFFVSIANIGVFLLFAVAFRDRRYAVPAVIAVVVATVFSVPALNDMGHRIPTEWIPALLASLAVLMTATRLPDRILNTIPLTDDCLLRHVDAESNRLTNRSLLMQTAHGTARNIVQITGCGLALITSVHWLGSSFLHFPNMFSDASVMQFGLIMVALAVYTIRNPEYAPGFAFWTLLSYFGFHTLVSIDHFHEVFVLNSVSYATVFVSLLGYAALRWLGHVNKDTPLRRLRQRLRASANSHDAIAEISDQRRLAFLVPLCDLSVLVLSCVVAPLHFLLLVRTHLLVLTDFHFATGTLLPSTMIVVIWLIAAAVLCQHRFAMVAATFAVPLAITAAIASSGFPLSASWCCVIWATVEAVVFTIASTRFLSSTSSLVSSTLTRISGLWLQALLLISCLTFAFPLRLVAAICLTAFLTADRHQLSRSRRTFFAVMVNFQLILAAAALGGCSGFVPTVFSDHVPAVAVPLVLLTAAFSLLVFDSFDTRHHSDAGLKGHSRTTGRSLTRFVTAHLDSSACAGWSAILRVSLAILAGRSLLLPQLQPSLIVIVMAGLTVFAIAEIRRAVRYQQEAHVWSACLVATVATGFLFAQNLISVGAGMSQFVLLAVATMTLTIAHVAHRRPELCIVRRPMLGVGQTLPSLVAGMAVLRETSGFLPSNSSLNALALMIAAGIYFQQFMTTRKRRFAVASGAVMNAGLMLLWQSLQWNALEFYLVPLGLSILAFVELLKRELPRASHDPLRYIGALTVLVSPVFEVLDGSWTHMLTLLVLSVVVILAAMGLRIRVLVYAGSAFLLADLVAMVVHSTVAQPTLLWIYGLAIGISVIVLAAVCENHREKLLTRIRLISAELATWN